MNALMTLAFGGGGIKVVNEEAPNPGIAYLILESFSLLVS